MRLASGVLHLLALTVAVAASAIPDGFTTSSALAAVIAALGVGAALFARTPFPERPVREVVLLGASLTAYCVAVSLTNGIDSSYTLLPVASIFLASVGGGIRAGAVTAIIATGGVLIAAAVADSLTAGPQVIRLPAFYAITAIAFSEAQRAIMAQSVVTSEALIAAHAAGSRMASLKTAHALLEDLLAVATSPNVSAVATAHDAIRDVAVIYPTDAARIVDPSGTVLARRGTDDGGPPTHIVEIPAHRAEAGNIELWGGNGELTDPQRTMIRSAIEPVGLAIENGAMLQELAGIAVQRERVRLARELHDDIAPSVASVGLTLDMLLLANQLDTEHTRNIEATRANVSMLVERIRHQVQDLRADRSRSLTDFAHSLVAEVDTEGPTVVVDLDERTPPRPAIAAEIRAILKEAFRNAQRHADASVVEIRGRIDETGGKVTVEDNGEGFDTGIEPASRFGLVGMRERAALINGDVTVDSRRGGGTLVTISWRDRP